MSKVTAHFEGSSIALELKAAILIYQSQGKTVATTHPVQLVKEKPFILPGRPIDQAAVVELMVSLSNNGQPTSPDVAKSQFLPPNVLCFTPNQLIWWCKSQVRPLYFESDDKQVKTLHGKNVTHPNLIFQVRDNGFFVYAVATNSRPELNTKLYRAPYFNIFQNNAMCKGNVKIPSPATPNVIAELENAFFDTHFTYSNVNDIVKGGHNKFWLPLRGNKKKRVPVKLLTPLDQTLASLLKLLSHAQ